MENDFNRKKKLIISAFVALAVIVCAAAVISALSRNSVYVPNNNESNVEQVSSVANEKYGESTVDINNKDSGDKGSNERTDSEDGEKSTEDSKDGNNDKDGKSSKEEKGATDAKGEKDSNKDSVEEDDDAESVPEQDDDIADDIVNVDSIAAPYISRLESLEAHYTAVINNAAEAAKREFLALPPDQQTEERKEAIISSKTGRLSSEEAQCDSQVSIILYELNGELVRSGLDTSIVGELRQRYYNEKASYSSRF